MKQTSKLGEFGEKLAEAYLKQKAYIILHHNWRNKHAEIDLIAQDGNKIVFIEVKYRTKTSFGTPETFVTNNKIRKMQEAASAYIEQYNWNGELRFDIIAINNKNEITHFQDAFY